MVSIIAFYMLISFSISHGFEYIKYMLHVCLLEVCKITPCAHLHPYSYSTLFFFLPHEQEHVVALNKQIVESGGKPLLGKDPSNINRLEWQSEEFLNAVLQRKSEYTSYGHLCNA